MNENQGEHHNTPNRREDWGKHKHSHSRLITLVFSFYKSNGGTEQEFFKTKFSINGTNTASLRLS